MFIGSDYRQRFYDLLIGLNLIEEFEDFAYREYMSDDEVVVIEKSRQVGMSFAMSVRCLVDALVGRGWVIFSESKEEARRKISNMRFLIDGLIGAGYDVGLKSNSRDSIEFANGGYVVALSYKGARGRGYSANVLIDECFWVPSEYLRELLLKINPARSRVGGVIRFIGTSSYRGHYLYESGLEKRGRWERIEWWNSKYFCKDVELARREARNLKTRERVYKFGKRNLVSLYEDYGSDIEFAREMECYVGDIEGSIVGVDSLMSLVDMDLDGGFYEGVVGFSQFLEDVDRDVSYYAGVDIGRYNNHTEIVLTDVNGNVRYNIDLGCIGFDEQKSVLSELMDRQIVLKMNIDASGLGMDLVEMLEKKYYGRVNGMVFTNETKKDLVRTFSRAVHSKKIRFYYLTDLIKQTLDMRIVVSNSGNILYKPESKKHNGDKFWALCLSLWGLIGGDYYTGESEYIQHPEYQYLTRIDSLKMLRKSLNRLFV